MQINMRNRQDKQLAVHILAQENAPAVIFSNSLGTDHGMWEPQVQALKDHYTVITYDTRGHGASDVIDDTTLQNLGEDIIDILDHFSIPKAHLCGISTGGITALWLGIYYPERFYSITVANSAAKIGTADAWNTRAETVKKIGLSELVKSTHSRWFSKKFDHQNHHHAQQTIQSLAMTPVHGYAHACSALAQADLREKIAEISIPTLIIVGEYDPVTTIEDGIFMQNKIPKSKLCVIQASHLSNIEQPKKFTQEFNKFIRTIQ